MSTNANNDIRNDVGKVDWTDSFDREKVAEFSDIMVDTLLLDIYEQELSLHKRHHLDQKEIAFLYRWPIHVGTNIFIEKLIRSIFHKDNAINETYPKVSYMPSYFSSTDESILNCYSDFSLNYNLLYNICTAINHSCFFKQASSCEQPRPQDSQLLKKSKNIISITKTILRKSMTFCVQNLKPQIVGEYSNWMREVLPLFNQMWFDFEDNRHEADQDSRNLIKECSRKVFFGSINNLINTLDPSQKENLSNIYADFIDNILPLSIVEGLNARFEYYKKIIKNWDVKQVHSFIGYFYSENLKIFAILAKRKNALLISHQHGCPDIFSSRKHRSNEMGFIDVYAAWGKHDCIWMKGGRRIENLRIISSGSSYLNAIKKWRKKKIDPNNIKVLYPSGPLVDFMSDLEAITPERNKIHRLRVLSFIKGLWMAYPGMKIFYKPFPGTYTNDPIKDYFAKELREGKIELFNDPPKTYYYKADFVLWDFISTGFAESIQSGVPTLVFQSQYEHSRALPLGKELYKELMKCGVLFHDVESGTRSFNSIINNLSEFKESAREPLKQFQEATAYPVSRKVYRHNLKELL